jgi:hypothetical protein
MFLSSGPMSGAGGSGVGSGSGGGENLSCAVDHVIRWATTVMTAVEKIQWRPLGVYIHLPLLHRTLQTLLAFHTPYRELCWRCS